MGTEISDDDRINILHLCDQVCVCVCVCGVCVCVGGGGGSCTVLYYIQGMLFSTEMIFMQVIEISDYRAQLYDYLRNRMMAIAPNLTLMVGELVGARLIAHAGQWHAYCYSDSEH